MLCPSGEVHFFARIIFMSSRALTIHFDFYGGVLGRSSSYPTSRRSNYLFENWQNLFSC